MNSAIVWHEKKFQSRPVTKTPKSVAPHQLLCITSSSLALCRALGPNFYWLFSFINKKISTYPYDRSFPLWLTWKNKQKILCIWYRFFQNQTVCRAEAWINLTYVIVAKSPEMFGANHSRLSIYYSFWFATNWNWLGYYLLLRYIGTIFQHRLILAFHIALYYLYHFSVLMKNSSWCFLFN